MSPVGGSTLITLAPKSDRITAAAGPAMTVLRSTTFNPEKILSFAMSASLINAKISCDGRPVKPALLLSVQHRKDPRQEICPDFIAVDLIQHFVPSTGIELVRNVVESRFFVSENQGIDSFELLADGIFGSRQHVDRQVFSYLAEIYGIG